MAEKNFTVIKKKLPPTKILLECKCQKKVINGPWITKVTCVNCGHVYTKKLSQAAYTNFMNEL